MPIFLVGPSECETKFSSKDIWYGLCENAWLHDNPYIILEIGGRPTNSIVPRVLPILEH